MNRLYLLLCMILFVSCESNRKADRGQTVQLEQPPGSYFEQQIDSLREAYKIPGIGIGVSINDSIHLMRGFGMADIEQGILMTANTPLRIASLTKPIFSTVLMHLVENGKIDLNWKISEHYPNYLRYISRTHRYLNEEMPAYSYLLDHYQPERNDILLKHHLSHTAENIPGTQYKYNGFLFGMLSGVVDEATGLKFDNWVDKLVIEKLSLKHSASSQLDRSKRKILDEIALPYSIDKNGNFQRAEFPRKELNAGAGLVFSVSDLLLFDKAFDSNRIISEESKEIVFKPFELEDQHLAPYGYGWFVQKYKGYTLVWHYGLQPKAYSGLYLKVLENDLTLVILANGENLSEPFDLGKGNVLNSKFATVFLDEFLKG